ncbi:hypothetical protein AXX17_AT1G09600 [Arabidopsis thaliana]|uniref:Uncharacterized protein n=1 Tax=Arabidopsis thaliana TaxID=3702 RepID=A0A178W8V7_ARATH|nr:hypothetical protein AXX17_AT1G09600 [Arabidopsis thaliana]
MVKRLKTWKHKPLDEYGNINIEDLLLLPEHDKAKYPLDEKAEKKKGAKNRTNPSCN